jgi:hypothetical protein
MKTQCDCDNNDSDNMSYFFFVFFEGSSVIRFHYWILLSGPVHQAGFKFRLQQPQGGRGILLARVM